MAATQKQCILSVRWPTKHTTQPTISWVLHMGKVYGSSILQKGTIPKSKNKRKKLGILEKKIIKFIDATNFAQGCFLLALRGLLAQSV